MKESQNFYTPDTINLQEVIPVYQEAFAGEPWFEVSKCADKAEIKRCVGGFSSLSIGACCGLCGEKLQAPAYDAKELEERFTDIASRRPTSWYVERNEQGTTLAALAWKATPLEIAEEKYPDNPSMRFWMPRILGDNPIMWLDEVFADRKRKPKGNLRNFKKMCEGLADTFNTNTIAYRTIAPAMILAPKRDYSEAARTFSTKENEVPDRRDFVIIQRGGERK